MIAYERRACAVLYNLLACHQSTGPILLPANVCPLVPITLSKAHRSFEFIDISLKTLCMDHDRVIERWLSDMEPPSGLIYVRTYGAIFDANALFGEIRRLTPTALIVDDRCACQPSFAASTLGKNVDAVLYSTGYAKYADIGHGGYAFLGDQANYKRACLSFDERALELQTLLYNNALSKRMNFAYLDNDWLDVQDPFIDWSTYQRAVEAQISKVTTVKDSINEIYKSSLPTEIQLSASFQSWRFNIHVQDKPGLLTAINNAGLFASGHYASLDGMFGIGSGVNAHFLQHHIINLFNDFYFDIKKAILISKIINNYIDLAPSNLKT